MSSRRKRTTELAVAEEDTEAVLKMIKPAQLDNFDIPDIVDGNPGYDTKKRLWSYCFTRSKIYKR